MYMSTFHCSTATVHSLPGSPMRTSLYASCDTVGTAEDVGYSYLPYRVSVHRYLVNPPRGESLVAILSRAFPPKSLVSSDDPHLRLANGNHDHPGSWLPLEAGCRLDAVRRSAPSWSVTRKFRTSPRIHTKPLCTRLFADELSDSCSAILINPRNHRRFYES
ncbi:hypothetical protein EYR41_005465 [Orbilia oligospora]|uniref:Uncharacterized protein n=1 Tax=Orbilia oligospora TaxID=2813651 RepID=A0A8H2HJZ7_ORBOL|nr:hypothetical protein TWF132_011321 [Orbilia oligospora]TGJ69419.1 hypothetical protein EYR41_005465 [Orbilia oligospora]